MPGRRFPLRTAFRDQDRDLGEQQGGNSPSTRSGQPEEIWIVLGVVCTSSFTCGLDGIPLSAPHLSALPGAKPQVETSKEQRLFVGGEIAEACRGSRKEVGEASLRDLVRFLLGLDMVA